MSIFKARLHTASNVLTHQTFSEACLNLPSASVDFSLGLQRGLNACLALTARLGEMSSLAENFHASKELEQAQTSDDQLEVWCQASNNYIN